MQEHKVITDRHPLVSVLTPVYNGEKYLTDCIESVLNQTYTNWEYVIVNNCSSDGSLDIAERYADQDSRIRIHNNTKFLNIIQNWNHAVKQISRDSRYCKVLHADDWLFPDCLLQMVNVAEANPSVGMVGAYRLFRNRVDLDGLPYPSDVVSGKEICRSFLRWMSGFGGVWVFGTPTSLLIRSDHIRKRHNFYNESNLHADTEACLDVLQDCDFGFVHQVLTSTRVHPEAQSSFSHNYNSYILGNLRILMKYGPVYLAPEEFEQCLNSKLTQYYRFLGNSVLRFREKQFWAYHKNALSDIGYPLRLGRLLVVSFKEALGLLLRPKKNLKIVLRRIRNNRKRSEDLINSS